MLKKTIFCLIAVFMLCIGLASATSFTTKIELELTGLTGISQIDNSDGTSVQVTIHNAAGGVVESRDAAAGIYKSGMVIPMTGSKFSMDYATDYTYNLSTIYGEFLYNFTTPAEPAGGASKSYTDNEDGTVTDTQTGLMWTKADGGTTTRSWNDAIDYCNNLITAGYTDWLLPTVVEGITMMDYSCGAAGDSCYSQFQNSELNWSTTTEQYWTSTTSPEYTNSAYVVSVGGGGVNDLMKFFPMFYVRCVRLE